MAFFDFINSFVEDNEKELQAAADGAAAVWSIGSKLAGMAADLAVDTAKEAYASLTEEEPAKEAPKAESTAADNDKALNEKLEALQRQIEELRKEKEELYSELCRREEQEEYDLEAWADEQQPEPEDEDEDCLPGIEVYENATQREVVVKLAGFGEAYAVQAMNYLLNKYPSGANLPWVKVDQEERCVTVLRPEGGFAYIGDESVEEML